MQQWPFVSGKTEGEDVEEDFEQQDFSEPAYPMSENDNEPMDDHTYEFPYELCEGNNSCTHNGLRNRKEIKLVVSTFARTIRNQNYQKCLSHSAR